MAMAIIARWRIPPENSWGYWLARSVGLGMPTSSSRRITRCSSCALGTLLCAVMISAIWSPTLYTGFSAVSASWKIIAMRAPRIGCICWLGNPISWRPRNLTEPVTIARFDSSPRMAIELTLLPEPDSPTMPSVSPSLIV